MPTPGSWSRSRSTRRRTSILGPDEPSGRKTRWDRDVRGNRVPWQRSVLVLPALSWRPVKDRLNGDAPAGEVRLPPGQPGVATSADPAGPSTGRRWQAPERQTRRSPRQRHQGQAWTPKAGRTGVRCLGSASRQAARLQHRCDWSASCVRRTSRWWRAGRGRAGQCCQPSVTAERERYAFPHPNVAQPS